MKHEHCNKRNKKGRKNLGIFNDFIEIVGKKMIALYSLKVNLSSRKKLFPIDKWISRYFKHHFKLI